MTFKEIMDNGTETVSGVLREMRGNEFDDPRLDRYGMSAVRRMAADWAGRIEAAYARETDSAIRTHEDQILGIRKSVETEMTCMHDALEDVVATAKMYMGVRDCGYPVCDPNLLELFMRIAGSALEKSSGASQCNVRDDDDDDDDDCEKETGKEM